MAKKTNKKPAAKAAKAPTVKQAPAEKPVQSVDISEATGRQGITDVEIEDKGLDSHVFGKGIKKAPAQTEAPDE